MASPDQGATSPETAAETNHGAASTEARAEEIVERMVSEGSRWVSRTFGRLREEVEDIVAEGRQRHHSTPVTPPATVEPGPVPGD